MTTVTVANPTTAAILAADRATFDASAYANVVVFASNLAGAETVEVFLGGGNVLVPATDPAGAALALTADSPSALLPGGPQYLFVKSATVGLSGVYAAPRRMS